LNGPILFQIKSRKNRLLDAALLGRDFYLFGYSMIAFFNTSKHSGLRTLCEMGLLQLNNKSHPARLTKQCRFFGSPGRCGATHDATVMFFRSRKGIFDFEARRGSFILNAPAGADTEQSRFLE
jgi:hypothetical protein